VSFASPGRSGAGIVLLFPAAGEETRSEIASRNSIVTWAMKRRTAS